MARELLSVMELPVVPLRTTVLFPHAALPMTLNRAAATNAAAAAGEEGLVAVVTQARAEAEPPGPGDLFAVGTGAVVRQLSHPGQDSAVVILEGLERVAILELVQTHPYLRARVRRLASVRPPLDAIFSAQRANLLDLFGEVVQHSPLLPDELALMARSVTDDAALTDMIASALIDTAPGARQDVLATLDVRRRIEKLNELLARELESLQLRDRLRTEVQDKIAESQRELVLREQLAAIRRELGEDQGAEQQHNELRERLERAALPEEGRVEVERELDRLRDIPTGSPEHSMVRTYLEWMADLPWGLATAGRLELRRSREILDEDHFDLQKVKARILEYLAVHQLRPSHRGPLLCLVGPPGVGKTSVGRSIARATGRAFVRISLGGTGDEAEIRGHRRTYIGALPGQIIRGLRRAGSCDPVFMLDEIDKLGRDVRGDPASALLEVLDPEQNATFRDHYLDVPFDLSQVMFIATANILDTIPAPLRDRMEVIELPGYIDEDKLQIAQRYLVPKQVEDHGLAGDAISPGLVTEVWPDGPPLPRIPEEPPAPEEPRIIFTDAAVLELVRGYTHEAGVRRLEQLIASLCRKRALQLAEGAHGTQIVDDARVAEQLGPARFRRETQLVERARHPGVAIAVAWTPHGGEVLFIESTRLPHGHGSVTLTGQMGEVMQESARTAVSWVRANGARYGIAPDALAAHDLHIHVPAGAVPKDGPSAGVVMVASLLSLLTDRPLRARVALTGEITLSGVLLPIGGLKEKVLAARRSGVTELVLPCDNEPDLREEVPAHLRGDVTLRLATTIEDAMAVVLEPSVPTQPTSTVARAARHVPPTPHEGDAPLAREKLDEIMTRDIYCVHEDTSVREAARLMRDHQIGDVLVTDTAGKLCGIVTDRDIVIRGAASDRALDQLRIGDIVSPRTITLAPDAPVEDAVQLMRDRAIRRIPIVDHDIPVGIVSLGDLAQTRDPDSALGRISAATPSA